MCFFYDPVNFGNLNSGSSAFSKPSLYIWKFLFHIMLKPSLKDFEHNLTSVGNECNCPVVWTFFITTLLGFPGSLDGKASSYNVGDLGLIPGSARSPGEGNGNPLQYSCLENPMDWGTWWATVHGIAKSPTRLSDFTFTFTLSLFVAVKSYNSKRQSIGTKVHLLVQSANTCILTLLYWHIR